MNLIYNGDYVYSSERDYKVDQWEHVKLILLITTNFSIIEDDGKSFDFSKKEEEQDLFLKAYKKSIFKRKQIINIVDNFGKRKTVEEIIKEIK